VTGAAAAVNQIVLIGTFPITEMTLTSSSSTEIVVCSISSFSVLVEVVSSDSIVKSKFSPFFLNS